MKAFSAPGIVYLYVVFELIFILVVSQFFCDPLKDFINGKLFNLIFRNHALEVSMKPCAFAGLQVPDRLLKVASLCI